MDITMNRIVLTLLLGLALLAGDAQATTLPDETKNQSPTVWTLPDVFMTWLQEEGFRPKREEGEQFVTLAFKYQGQDLELVFSKEDQQFYNLVDYIVMTPENTGEGGTVSEEDKYLRLQAVNQATAIMKVVKAYLDDDSDIVLRVELFDDGTPNPKGVMLRYLDVLAEAKQTVISWYWKLKEAKAK